MPQRISREQMIDFLLKADESKIIDLREVTIKEPEPARIHKSVKCDI
jgi:hypothetical protein